MTENETIQNAIQDLQYLIEKYSAYPPETGVCSTIETLQFVIEKLEEIREYKKLGTVNELKEKLTPKTNNLSSVQNNT